MKSPRTVGGFILLDPERYEDLIRASVSLNPRIGRFRSPMGDRVVPGFYRDVPAVFRKTARRRYGGDAYLTMWCVFLISQINAVCVLLASGGFDLSCLIGFVDFLLSTRDDTLLSRRREREKENSLRSSR